MKIDAYPLQWPIGWKRTSFPKTSKFETSFTRARDEIFRELKLMGVSNNWANPTNIILSTNIPLRQDGLPYAGQSNPKDAGVAVYFKYKSKDMVFACDAYKKVEENLWAVKKTIEALRGIERWGASQMMERSFTGFEALPPPTSTKKEWWDVLECRRDASPEFVRERWKFLAQIYHPDKPGGSEAKMAELNRAYQEGMRK